MCDHEVSTIEEIPYFFRRNLTLPSETANFHSYKQHARWLQVGILTNTTAGKSLAACLAALAFKCFVLFELVFDYSGQCCGWLQLLNTHPAVMYIKLLTVRSMHCVQSFAGNLQSQSIADKPGPSKARLPESPDISLLRPELQQQWHVERNMHLGAITVKPQSNIKAVWHCHKCPAGQPHIWTAAVHSRTRGAQYCPYCLNMRVCLHNSLATVAPDQTRYWNYDENEKAPDQVSAGSSLRAEWKCPACKHEWQAPIQMRTRNRAGCPKCSRALKVTQPQPTFAEAQPACLAEWDFERNDAQDIYPHSTTLGSVKLVHWICSSCPRGQPHHWTASPNNRIGKGTGCAVCAGKQACVCNSLISLSPSVAAELDLDMNGFSPSQVTAGSSKNVWWRNAKRVSWRQAVHIRTHFSRWILTPQVNWTAEVQTQTTACCLCVITRFPVRAAIASPSFKQTIPTGGVHVVDHDSKSRLKSPANKSVVGELLSLLSV